MTVFEASLKFAGDIKFSLVACNPAKPKARYIFYLRFLADTNRDLRPSFFPLPDITTSGSTDDNKKLYARGKRIVELVPQPRPSPPGERETVIGRSV